MRQLAEESHDTNGHVFRSRAAAPGAPTFLDECVAAVKSLDACTLEETLKRAATELGAQGLLQRVVTPLAQTIGDLWRAGTITAAHEHFASAVIRSFLGHAAKPFAETESAPVLRGWCVMRACGIKARL